MNTAILAGIVCALLGWFLNNLYQGINDKINGKIDKGCHDQCTKAKEAMSELLLQEIRANRKTGEDLLKSFNEKSKLVIDAVESK